MKLIPPFDAESAERKARAAEFEWNTRDPEFIAQAYSINCEWRNGNLFLRGRKAIEEHLADEYAHRLHYRIIHQLSGHTADSISLRYESEWQDCKSGQWYRSHGDELWEFADDGLLLRCETSSSNFQIEASARRVGFDARPIP